MRRRLLLHYLCRGVESENAPATAWGTPSSVLCLVLGSRRADRSDPGGRPRQVAIRRSHRSLRRGRLLSSHSILLWSARHCRQDFVFEVFFSERGTPISVRTNSM